MSGESKKKNMSEVNEKLVQGWNDLVGHLKKQNSGEAMQPVNQEQQSERERETKLRHQFQTHWDERERLHERDLAELRQRFDKHIQTERTQKAELEKELARVNRELVAVRQDAEVLGHADSVRLGEELRNLQRIHAQQCEMILKANEEKQDLRNRILLERERSVKKLDTMEGMIRDIRMIIVSWENEGGNQHE